MSVNYEQFKGVLLCSQVLSLVFSFVLREIHVSNLKDLYSMVMSVGNYHSTIFGESYATRKLELSILVSFFTKFGVKFAIRLENLSSMVLEITHNDESLRIDCDSPGTVELATSSTFPAETELKFAFAIKLHNPVVFGVGYQATVVLGDRHLVWTVKFLIVAAKGTKRHDVSAIHIEELYSVVIFISNQQVAIVGQS